MISRYIILLVFISLMPVPALASDWSYTFRPDDNLWDLSNKYLISNKHYAQLQVLNNINDPKNIPAGTIIKIPVKWLKKRPSSALVVDSIGKVTIIHVAENANSVKATSNKHLYTGDRIITGPDSSATLVFADQSRLILHANSELVMDALSQYGDTGMVDTNLRLPAGRVDSQVNPEKGPATRYEITTPAAVAAVRGTEFRMSTDPVTTITRSEVLKGLIGVSAQKTTTDVPEGFGTITKQGTPPQKPRKLLPPPDTSTTRKKIIQLPIELKWKVLSGAKTYRIQVFPKNAPGRVLIDQITDTAFIKINSLEDNHYILRVRGTDDIGLEGLNRDHEFNVVTKPLTPVLTDPQSDSTVNVLQPKFTWVVDERARYYHLQLSTDPEFRQLVIDKTDLKLNRFKPDSKLQAKTLYWRVAGINKAGIKGGFSETGKFTINTRPVPVIMGIPKIDNHFIYFQWFTKESGNTFQFQIKTQNAYYDSMKEFITMQNSLGIARPVSGIYYYRVREIKNSGQTHAFSRWHRIDVPPLYYWPVPKAPFPAR